VVIYGFEWDDDNIFHIERHAFTPEEVEEVFSGDHKVRRARQQRYIALARRWTAAWLLSYFGDYPEVS
jgi:uncharacterized DUF497 family protein